MTWLLLALLGLALGSFFNVVIHRVPRKQSIVSPPSHCPKCRKRIRPWDNIPVLSYLLLRGRCRYCRNPISPRYLAVEALTAGLFLAVFARFGYDWATPAGIVFVSLLLVMAMIDLEHQIIPFSISIPGLVLGVAASFLPPDRLVDTLIGAAVGAGFVLFAWLLWRFVLAGLFRRFGIDQKEGMGGGDLPLAAMIGAFLGWQSTIVALFAAVVSGVVVGLVLRWTGKSRAGQHVPFGPFLAFGALVGLFAGPQLFGWYLNYILS